VLAFERGSRSMGWFGRSGGFVPVFTIAKSPSRGCIDWAVGGGAPREGARGGGPAFRSEGGGGVVLMKAGAPQAKRGRGATKILWFHLGRCGLAFAERPSFDGGPRGPGEQSTGVGSLGIGGFEVSEVEGGRR